MPPVLWRLSAAVLRRPSAALLNTAVESPGPTPSMTSSAQVRSPRRAQVQKPSRIWQARAASSRRSTHATK
eukprot:13406206-Alexandrium_andersonii.AAC.1